MKIDNKHYIQTLSQMQNELRKLEEQIEGEVSCCAWNEYHQKFSKLINGMEVLINLMTHEKKKPASIYEPEGGEIDMMKL